jgi:DNA-binding IclR family transcriptional regulator
MNGKSMVQKTVDVLFYLSGKPRGASLTEIAKNLRFPKTTVFDILKTLLQNDFVHYTDTRGKTYGIGAQIYAVGMTYFESSTVFSIAVPYLMFLADKYKKTAFISKRHNDRATCVYKYISPYAKASTSGIGGQKMLHSTAIGKCYLAFDAAAVALIDTIELVRCTPYTITSRERLKEHIREIKALGYAYEKRESFETMACLAAPLFDQGSMVGTISMTGLYDADENFSVQGNEMAQIANIISKQLK